MGIAHEGAKLALENFQGATKEEKQKRIDYFLANGFLEKIVEKESLPQIATEPKKETNAQGEIPLPVNESADLGNTPGEIKAESPEGKTESGPLEETLAPGNESGDPTDNEGENKAESPEGKTESGPLEETPAPENESGDPTDTTGKKNINQKSGAKKKNK